MTGVTPAIHAEGLRKSFGETQAVTGVDLLVRPGTVHGVLGPNGAGKTTAVRMLATLLKPDGGHARIFGHDIVEESDTVRQLVSLTGQFASVDEDLTGYENLMLLARLLGYSGKEGRMRTWDLLESFDLTEAARRQVKTYSGGMRRRIDIAASIVVTPQVLFLDEPTTGLDPRSRNQVWDIVRTVVSQGTTVLLTTQYLDEADQLADQISIIDHGKVIAEGTSGELKSSLGSGVLSIRLFDPSDRPKAEAMLANLLDTSIHLELDDVALTAQVQSAELASRSVTALSEAGIGVATFSLGQPSLDEVFLALTGRPADESQSEEEVN